MSRRGDLLGAGGVREEVLDELFFAAHLLVDGADGERAGHLAGGVPAHAVADHEEPDLLVDEEVVLVVIPDSPHVGGGIKAERIGAHGRWGG